MGRLLVEWRVGTVHWWPRHMSSHCQKTRLRFLDQLQLQTSIYFINLWLIFMTHNLWLILTWILIRRLLAKWTNHKISTMTLKSTISAIRTMKILFAGKPIIHIHKLNQTESNGIIQTMLLRQSMQLWMGPDHTGRLGCRLLARFICSILLDLSNLV